VCEIAQNTAAEILQLVQAFYGSSGCGKKACQNARFFV